MCTVIFVIIEKTIFTIEKNIIIFIIIYYYVFDFQNMNFLLDRHKRNEHILDLLKEIIILVIFFFFFGNCNNNLNFF